MQQSPVWLLICLTCVAFIESFLIIGLLVPGVVLLFGLATLAGQLQIPLILCLIFGFLGAVLGDGISFYLGYHYHKKIFNLKIFQKHPHWVKQGESFFQKHGIASIVFGRFIGPLRPIVPMIAGAFEMPPRKFLLVNVISATLWAPAYLLPGYGLGHTLNHSSSVKYEQIIFIVIFTLLFWSLSQFINWCRQKGDSIVTLPSIKIFNKLWYGGVGLVVFSFLCFIASLLLFQTNLINSINESISNSLKMIKGGWFDMVFQTIEILLNPKLIMLCGVLFLMINVFLKWWLVVCISLLMQIVVLLFDFYFSLFGFFGGDTNYQISISQVVINSWIFLMIIILGFINKVVINKTNLRWGSRIMTTFIWYIGLVSMSLVYFEKIWFSELLLTITFSCFLLTCINHCYDFIEAKKIG